MRVEMSGNQQLAKQLKREILLLEHQLSDLEKVELDTHQRRLAAECQVRLESRSQLLTLLDSQALSA